MKLPTVSKARRVALVRTLVQTALVLLGAALALWLIGRFALAVNQ